MKKWEGTSLQEKERQGIEEATKSLKASYPIDTVILFGSKARGDWDPHSDVDLLLITSRRLHWKEEKAIVEELFEIGMRYDVIFSPLFVSSDEWKGELFKEFPIYKNIMKEGATVA